MFGRCVTGEKESAKFSKGYTAEFGIWSPELRNLVQVICTPLWLAQVNFSSKLMEK